MHRLKTFRHIYIYNTATTSPANRKQIIKSLCFKSDNVLILDSPDRENIKTYVFPIPNNAEDEKLF